MVSKRNKLILCIFLLSIVSFGFLHVSTRNLYISQSHYPSAVWPPKHRFDGLQEIQRGMTPDGDSQISNFVTPQYQGPFEPNEKITILMWDGMTPFGWAQGDVVRTPNYGGFVYHKEKCPVECIWTTDRNILPSADAVLFDPCLTGPVEYRQVPVHMPDKYYGQRWGWFTYEQYYYFPMMREEDYMSRFDFKFTYHHDALVQITFVCPWGGLNTFLDTPPPKTNSKGIIFAASNCNTGGAERRTDYVRELMRYIHIDSYGACLHNIDQPWRGINDHGEKMADKIRQIGEYKFVLAFENNDRVDDYVTEKIVNAFQAGTVPVYWGSPTIDLWLPGPHSVIKTTDFDSPKALAEYLKYLLENEDEYMKYFEWKKNGLSPTFERLLDHCLFFQECRLCKQIAGLKSTDGGLKRPKYVPDRGVVGYALSFNELSTKDHNRDDYIEIPHDPSLSLTDSFTLMAWVKLNHLQDGRIMDKNTAGRVEGYEFDIEKISGDTKGRVRLCAGAGCVLSERKISIGIWYHVAVTYSMKDDGRDGIKFYINGKFDTSHKAHRAISTNSLPLRFGKASAGAGSWRPHHASSIFDGTLDEPSIWERALDLEEIKEYMFLRPNGDEEGLVGWWTFNEGEGDIVLDSSLNENHGKFVGNPIWVKSLSKPLMDPSNVEYIHENNKS